MPPGLIWIFMFLVTVSGTLMAVDDIGKKEYFRGFSMAFAAAVSFYILFYG